MEGSSLKKENAYEIYQHIFLDMQRFLQKREAQGFAVVAGELPLPKNCQKKQEANVERHFRVPCWKNIDS